MDTPKIRTFSKNKAKQTEPQANQTIKPQHQTASRQNSNTRPYKAKTTELSQPQGKAAKSAHTKPNIRDKTGKPVKHRQNNKISTHKTKRP